MRYNKDMETSALKEQKDATAQTVASNLAAELARQRWSDRKAATALGLSNVYISRRTSGVVECSASDLAMFAGFLKISVAAFYKEVPGEAGIVTLDTSVNADRRSSDYSSVVSLADYRRPTVA